MKYLAAPLAAIVFAGFASSAMAFQLPSDYRSHQPHLYQSSEASAYDNIYHHCHGHASGTADRACGTRTGGPAGGLF